MPTPSHSAPPPTLGPFRLVRLLGEGGMGTVYLGERIDQFRQQVAIKILHPQLFPEEADASLQRETRLMAALDHPGIVHMLDAGLAPDRLRYIVMEYVDGQPLDRFCDEQRLPLRRRIELLIEICEAVEYAHRHLVIHADLKPENILVTAEGKPRLLDFGVASVVSELGANITASTSFTPLYASPEQRSGERLTIASDLYSLGAVAHGLLAGALPRAVAFNTAIPAIPLSKSLSQLPADQQQQIAVSRSTTLKALIAALRGDLDAIVAKATHPDPALRFQSVQEFADELRRHLAGQPILTRRTSRSRQLWKWALRNPLAAGLTTILILALALSSIGVLWRARQATRNRQIAVTRLHELVRLTDVLAGELYSSIQTLPASAAAQQALLDNAHQTIGKLAAIVEGDRQLELELAREYEKLARIELTRNPQSKATVAQATDDLRYATELASRLPQNDQEVVQINRELAQLGRLRDASTVR